MCEQFTREVFVVNIPRLCSFLLFIVFLLVPMSAFSDTEVRRGNRIFVGSAGGLTVIDEAVGTLDFAKYGDTAHGVLPWDRVNKARYRVYSPRAMTDGQFPTDSVDDIIALDANKVIIIQKGIRPGERPTIAMLDLSAEKSQRQEFYTHGPGADAPLILHTENPTTKEITTDYHLSDAIGSITELVSKDGAVTGELAYNSFGKIVHSSGNAFDNLYSYTGREFDLETNLYYNRARYYNSEIGAFLSQDPLAVDLSGDIDMSASRRTFYGYARGNPILYVDASGASEKPTLGSLLTSAGIIGTLAEEQIARYLPVIQNASITMLRSAQALALRTNALLSLEEGPIANYANRLYGVLWGNPNFSAAIPRIETRLSGGLRGAQYFMQSVTGIQARYGSMGYSGGASFRLYLSSGYTTGGAPQATIMINHGAWIEKIRFMGDAVAALW